MNRREFMGQLERLLADIPGQERQEALDFYNNYFDDAGAENEDQVIRELGSPGKVAAIIKADLNEGGKSSGSFTDAGYEDERFDDRHVPQRKRRYGYQARRQKRSGGIILLIVLAVFTFPFWGGVGAGIIGIFTGLLGVLLTILIGPLAIGIAFTIGGVAMSIIGVINMTGSVAVGLALFGTGIILLALGLLFLLAFGWLVHTVLPRLLRWIADTGNRIFHRGKGDKTI